MDKLKTLTSCCSPQNHSTYVRQSLFYGTMIFLFLMTVKVNISSVMSTGKKTCTIGVCSCVLPLLFTLCAASILRQVLSPEIDLYKSLFFIATFSSTGSFQVTTSVLEDFKLLNSEVGRLTISASLVNGLISKVWHAGHSSLTSAKSYIWKHKKNSSKMTSLFFIVTVIIIVCVLRPIMLWMIRKTPKGKRLRESSWG